MVWYIYVVAKSVNQNDGLASVVWLLHAGSGDASVPTGDSSDELNEPPDESNSTEPTNISNSNYWRDVRANLVRREQVRVATIHSAHTFYLGSNYLQFDMHLGHLEIYYHFQVLLIVCQENWEQCVDLS
jgi:hypothetical protein